MKKKDWNEGLNHIDSDLVEEFVLKSIKLEKKKENKQIWIRFGAIAVCLFLMIGAIVAVPLLHNDTSIPHIPVVNIQTSSAAPHYYGSASSVGMSVTGQEAVNPSGISVTAKLMEMLPDTYTFFDDWRQQEYRLLRMQVVTLLKGQEMTEEFYYMVPVAFMTDFSIFDKFVIFDMAQFGYEYSVLYNKTQNAAEQLPLVLFGYRSYGQYLMGENIMAFDDNGHFDARLWESNNEWISETERADPVATLQQAEEKARQADWGEQLYVHSLKDISGEAAEILSTIRAFENGLYVPDTSGSLLRYSPEVQFQAVRYINGFATNERVRIWSKEWNGGEQDTFSFTKARFDDADFAALPDLTSAITAVATAYDKGELTPPHIKNLTELTPLSHGIFGWYAKTPDGVIGIVRVTWQYRNESWDDLYDDMYYIVASGSNSLTPIERDSLLEMLGNHETTFIYDGEYDENGKDRGEIPYY